MVSKTARILLQHQATVPVQQEGIVRSFGKQRYLLTITQLAKDTNALSNSWTCSFSCKGQLFTLILILLSWYKTNEKRLSLLHSTYTQALKQVGIWKCSIE